MALHNCHRVTLRLNLVFEIVEFDLLNMVFAYSYLLLSNYTTIELVEKKGTLLLISRTCRLLRACATDRVRVLLTVCV